MITSKISSYLMVILLFTLLSCKKDDKDSDLTFTQKCNFSDTKVEVVKELSGTLKYTNRPLGITFATGTVFLIETPGRLPMFVCNMPETYKLEKDKPVKIIFSGRTVVISDKADALNTDIELSYVKFK